MIFDEIAELIENKHKKMTAGKLAKIFNRERKWVYSVGCGCTFHCDYDFVCGLNKLGYDLKLVKTKGE